MAATPESMAFDRAVEGILKVVLLDRADQLLDFLPDKEIQERIDELAERSTEGTLTPIERAEYEGYVRANKFIAILQRQARRIAAQT